MLGDVDIRKRERLQDAEVVRQVLGGDRDRFREIVERYQKQVYTVLLRLVNNSDDAQDLAQAAFVDAFRALERFDTGRSFYSWLMRIAVNKGKDHLKSHKRKEGHFTGEITTTGAMHTGRMYGPEQEATARERMRMVNTALKELDPKYRIPLLLKEINGLSYKQMQEVLDLPVTTLKIRVVRAREKLHEVVAWMTSEKS